MKLVLLLPVLIPLLLLQGCNEDPERWIRKGNQLFAANKLDDAVLNYKKAIQLNPKFAEAHYRLATVYLRRGQRIEAFTSLNNALALQPEHREAMVALVDLCLPELLLDSLDSRNLYNKVRDIGGRLLSQDPNSFDGLRVKGFLAMSDGRAGEAAESFAAAGKLNPSRPEVRLALIQSLLMDGREDEALRASSSLIAEFPDYFPVYDTLYIHYRSKNRAADAQRVLEQKISNNPKQATYVLQLCQHYLDTRRPQEAKRLIQTLMDNPTKFPEAPAQIGDFYGGQSQWTDALFYFEEGLRRNPAQKSLYQKRVAAAQIKLGRLNEARMLLDQLLKDDPKDLEAHTQRGSLLMALREPAGQQTGLQDFEYVCSQTPNDSGARENFGDALAASGKLDAARAQYLTALKAGAPTVSLQLALADLSLRQSRFPDAISFSSGLAEMKHAHPRALLIRAISYIGVGDLPRARTDLKMLVAANEAGKETREAQLQLAMLALTEHKFQEAQATFEDLYKPGSPDLRPLRSLVLLYIEENKLDRAIQLLKAEVSLQPASEELWSLQTRTLLEHGHLAEAVENCRGYAAHFPQSASAHRLLGIVYLESGDFKSAIESLRRAEQFAPGDSEIQSYLASALQRAGVRDEAGVVFEKALKMRPDDPILLNNYAYFLADSGLELDRALRMSQGASRLLPSLDFSDTTGWVYLKQKKVDSAIQVFQSLVTQQPSNAMFQYHLALAWMDKGDRQRARSELSKARSLNPPPQEMAHVQELLRSVQ